MRNLILISAAAAISVLAGFVYCGGDVDKPSTPSTTGGDFASTPQESPAAAAPETTQAARIAGDAHAPLHVAPPPYLETPTPHLPPDPCITCPPGAPVPVQSPGPAPR